MLAEEHISLEGLLEDLDGDRQMLGEILGDFDEEYSALRVKLQEDLSTGNIPEASRRAHSMKSGLGALDCQEGVTMADRIHRLCEEEKVAEARKIMESFDPLLREVLEQVRTCLDTLEGKDSEKS